MENTATMNLHGNTTAKDVIIQKALGGNETSMEREKYRVDPASKLPKQGAKGFKNKHRNEG